jgi:hypothetical protein
MPENRAHRRPFPMRLINGSRDRETFCRDLHFDNATKQGSAGHIVLNKPQAFP